MRTLNLANNLMAVEILPNKYKWKIKDGFLCYKDAKNSQWNIYSQPTERFDGEVVELASNLNYQYLPTWDIDFNKTLIIKLNTIES